MKIAITFLNLVSSISLAKELIQDRNLQSIESHVDDVGSVDKEDENRLNPLVVYGLSGIIVAIILLVVIYAMVREY